MFRCLGNIGLSFGAPCSTLFITHGDDVVRTGENVFLATDAKIYDIIIGAMHLETMRCRLWRGSMMLQKVLAASSTELSDVFYRTYSTSTSRVVSSRDVEGSIAYTLEEILDWSGTLASIKKLTSAAHVIIGAFVIDTTYGTPGEEIFRTSEGARVRTCTVVGTISTIWASSEPTTEMICKTLHTDVA